MKNKIKKIGIISGILLMFSIVIFFCLSDMNKAKISLKLLGVHKENITEFSAIKNMILDNQFIYCQERENIPQHIVDLIEKDYNKTPNRDSISTLSDIYAIEGELWSSGCQPGSEIPGMKFNELHYSDNALVISYKSGGLAVSNKHEFYKINADTFSVVGLASSPVGPDIFSFALMLKYDENMFEHIKYQEGLLQTN